MISGGVRDKSESFKMIASGRGDKSESFKMISGGRDKSESIKMIGGGDKSEMNANETELSSYSHKSSEGKQL